MKEHHYFPLSDKDAIKHPSVWFRLESLIVTLNTSREAPFRYTENYPLEKQWQVQR